RVELVEEPSVDQILIVGDGHLEPARSDGYGVALRVLTEAETKLHAARHLADRSAGDDASLEAPDRVERPSLEEDPDLGWGRVEDARGEAAEERGGDFRHAAAGKELGLAHDVNRRPEADRAGRVVPRRVGEEAPFEDPAHDRFGRVDHALNQPGRLDQVSARLVDEDDRRVNGETKRVLPEAKRQLLNLGTPVLGRGEDPREVVGRDIARAVDHDGKDLLGRSLLGVVDGDRRGRPRGHRWGDEGQGAQPEDKGKGGDGGDETDRAAWNRPHSGFSPRITPRISRRALLSSSFVRLS